jgi:hypothetical protein
LATAIQLNQFPREQWTRDDRKAMTAAREFLQENRKGKDESGSAEGSGEETGDAREEQEDETTP